MNDDANSLLELSLSLLEQAGQALDPSVTEPGPVADSSQTPPPEPKNPTKIRYNFTNFLDSQDQKYRQTLAEFAWICVSCETINGVDTKGRIRKTCSKCKRLKGESREVIDLLMEDLNGTI